MKVTNKDYAKAAQRALKETFGFAPALKNITLLEGGDDGMIVTSVAFSVAGKGYSWTRGYPVERSDIYDL